MTPEGLVIRDADEADLGRVVELLVLGAVPGGASHTEDPDELALYRSALRDIAGSGSAVLAAEWAGEVVGVCQLVVFRHIQVHGGLCAEVESMHVHPDHRNGGVGAALIGEAVARTRRQGCYRVHLTSNTVRFDAHRLYEQLGFVPSHVGFKLLLT